MEQFKHIYQKEVTTVSEDTDMTIFDRCNLDFDNKTDIKVESSIFIEDEINEDMHNIEFVKTHFVDIDFNKCDMYNCSFINCTFSMCRNMVLINSDMKNCEFIYTKSPTLMDRFMTISTTEKYI